MEDSGVKKVSLDEIFGTDKHYQVPNYQRPYSWTSNEASTLYEDIYEAWQKSATSKETYFLGSIVLALDGNNKYEVIDGQQRLTTISILLASLYVGCKNADVKSEIDKYLVQRQNLIKNIEETPRVSLRDRDMDFYKKYILNYQFEYLFKQAPADFDDDAKRLLRENAITFMNYVNRDFPDGGRVLEFVQYLMTQCYLVRIITENETEAFRIFSVLNNRGLSLLPSDIIKSELIGKISENKRDYYSLRWEELENSIGRDHFNSFLSYIRMIVAKSKLRKTLVEDFRKLFLEGRRGSEVFDDVIDPYGKAFCKISSSTTGNAKIDSLLFWMGRIDDTDWVPVALLLMQQFADDTDFLEEAFTELERLAAFMFLTSRSSNIRIERYANVLFSAEKGQKESVISQLALSSDEQHEFMSLLDGDIYILPPRKRSYVVARLNSFFASGSLEFRYQDFTIEHVLPQNPSDAWMSVWGDSNQRLKWTNRISNLIPLTRRKNSEALNKSFEYKKEKYFTSAYGVTEFPLSTQICKYEAWTPQIVEKRQKQLLKVFSVCWRLGDTTPLEEVLMSLPLENRRSSEDKANQNKKKIDKSNATETALERVWNSIGVQFIPASNRMGNSQFWTIDRQTYLHVSFSKYGKDYYYTLRDNVLKKVVATNNSYVMLGFGQAEKLFLFCKEDFINIMSIEDATGVNEGRCDIHIKKNKNGHWELTRSNYSKKTIIDEFEI